MMNRLEALATYLCTDFHYKVSARLLRRGLSIMVLYSLLILSLPMHELLWGEHSLIQSMRFSSLWTNELIMILHKERFANLYPLFIGLALVGIGLTWKSKWIRFGALLVFLSMSILYQRAFTYLTGGNYLLHLMLFYLILINEQEERRTSVGQELSNLMSNLGIWACRLQLIIVYLFSGAYKLAGDTWRNGEAVYLITHIDEFTLPWFENSVAEWHVLMVLANYIALAYFLSFPILVWSKKWKLLLLAIGTLIHLSFAVIIGVFDFSLIMIACYAVFLDEKDVQRLRALILGKKWSASH